MTERFDGPDPELEAQLDALVRRERPRPDFEAELWTRIMAGHKVAAADAQVVPLRRRRLLPVWQLGAAAAAVLVVTVAGIGLSRLGGLPGAGTAGSNPTIQSAPASDGASAQAGFGQLPAPGASGPRPGAALNATPGDSAYGATPGGPANPVVPRKTPVTSGVLVVYRWHEPGPAEAASFASMLGATPAPGQPPPGVLGSYDIGGGVLQVLPSATAVGPTFQVSVQPGGAGLATGKPQSAPDARARADLFLSSHHLTPTWPYQASVAAGASEVTYQRTFGGALEVDLDGRPRGIVVTLDPAGAVAAVSGDLPLALDTSDYPMAAAPNGASLAYIAVPDGAFGYFEPVWLTGLAGGAVGFQPAISARYIRP